jgi:rhomboid family GlyGly-CTERM serine protease
METFRRLVSAGGRLPGVSLLLAGAAVCLQCSPAALEWLQYDRAGIAAGELWRIVTGHLTHASWDHLLWDAAALMVMGTICERDQRRGFVACICASAIALSLCLSIAMPDLAIYRGLSGIDSAVFVFLAVVLLRQSLAAGQKWWSAGIVAVLCGFGLKVAFEYATGRTLFVDSGAAVMTPVPLVHVVGGVIGGLVGLWTARLRGADGQRTQVRLNECPFGLGGRDPLPRIELQQHALIEQVGMR